ncbi:acyltransferase family protein [Henriciella litoralis]|uniref:acyltransferase family protein n=1 Tax=Henriciella litoralis TaxID=568102 RepID=UPI0009FE9687|nr:acyltransferase family protein [Henriciella litoralis]
MKFRQDIQGLRALAVISVILFHIDVSVFQGGFLGVDIFFVISGFLITGIILNERESGDFNFTNFYVRRLRRLMPASVFTILVTLIAAYFFFGGSDFAETGRTGLHALLFTSNIVFWLDAGYFDAEAYMKPFLHFWSLSVEEQFYLLWPAIIVLAFAIGKRAAVLATILLLTAASVGAAEWFYGKDPAAVFFLTPFRVFEFGGGALLSVYGWRFKNQIVQEVGFIVGLSLMLGSIIVFDEVTRMPGIISLVPTLGCMLCLMTPDAKTGVILKNPITTSVGNASYSLYLAHWAPIVFFKSAYSETLEPLHQIGLLAGGLILGYLMYFTIETPFRREGIWTNSGRGGGRIVLGAFASIGVLYLSANIWATNGWQGQMIAVETMSAQSGQLGSAPVRAPVLITDRKYLRSESNQHRESLNKRALDPGKPTVLVIGDSHGKDFANVLSFMGDFNVRHEWINQWCQPIIGPRTGEYKEGNKTVTRKDIEACEKHVPTVLESQLAADADILVFHARWEPWSMEYFGDTLQFARSKTDAKLVCIGEGATFDQPVPRLVELSDKRASVDPVEPLNYDKTLEFNKRFFEIAESNGCLPLKKIEMLCSEGRCPIASEAENAIYYYDKHHLSLSGAAHYARLISSECDDPACAALKALSVPK